MNKIRSCFSVNILIKCNLHVILVLYCTSFFSSGWGKLFFRPSIRLHYKHTPYLCPLPDGAPAGCCCFLYHLCWHGERRLRGPRALLCLQNRKSTLLSDAHWRQKTNRRGSLRRQAEEDDNRRVLSFCPWSLLTVRSRGKVSVPAAWIHGMLDSFILDIYYIYFSCFIPLNRALMSLLIAQQLLDQVLSFLAFLTFQPAL